jgi:hypothetical protein
MDHSRNSPRIVAEAQVKNRVPRECPLWAGQSGEKVDRGECRCHCERSEAISWRLRAALGIAASFRFSQ